MLKPPSSKLSGKDRAAVVAKELGDFLGHYKKETEMFTVFREEAGMIPRSADIEQCWYITERVQSTFS